MLRPAGHRTHGTGLRRVWTAGVATSMPVVWIHALEIERAFDHAGENLVIGQVGGEAPQRIEIGLRHLLLDLVPVRWAFSQVIRLKTDDLQGVLARGRAAPGQLRHARDRGRERGRRPRSAASSRRHGRAR